MQISKEVPEVFPGTKDFQTLFIDGKLEQKCAKENISVEEVIHFLLL